ncbi:DUF6130 family protein [Pseudomonas entomophila]|uniref:DUF6130 family protein n=1 Tax=Pseudomonas entomophila TaxID=312306 RepID=UPI0023D863D6|nr:DUF6130 family protein [Pseudomonas entomophila]MDF0729230.1 DUF6130 family protein [Pseudomonas entomophila]
MSVRFNAAAVLLALSCIALSPISFADTTHTAAHAGATEKHPDANAERQPKPKLVLSAPRADFLKEGVVYLPFRVENMTILPVYSEIHGEAVTEVQPPIGHLHAMVDDNQWAWVHASADPLYFSPLPSGTHKLKVELADASHNVLETQTIELVVP